MSTLDCNAVVVVTGASRGIGRECALQMAARVGAASRLVLVARDERRLNAVRDEARRVSPTLDVRVLVADFAAEDTRAATIAAAVGERLDDAAAAARLVLVVHNAGSVGDVTRPVHELNDGADWHAHLQSNAIAALLLNNAIYARAAAALAAGRIRLIVVDITALAAVTALPSFGPYAVVKAAREAYFRAFACEVPAARVLSYSPGPVDTDMRTHVIENTFSADLRAKIASQGGGDVGGVVNRGVLTPTITVNRLMDILGADTFKSGTRIDYFNSP